MQFGLQIPQPDHAENDARPHSPPSKAKLVHHSGPDHRPDSHHLGGSDCGEPGRYTTRFAKQFTGRDVYSPDVHPNPVGSGYIMWYAGWQSQQTLDSGQLDTIYRRTAPTSDGPWSSPTTVLVASQVAPQVTEVNDPSVSIIAAGSSLRYAMFFTTLVCHPDAPGCATTQQQSANSPRCRR